MTPCTDACSGAMTVDWPTLRLSGLPLMISSPRDTFPEDWKYYTLTFPVARYTHLSPEAAIQEMVSCDQHFYSVPRVLRRLRSSVRGRRQPLISLVGNPCRIGAICA